MSKIISKKLSSFLSLKNLQLVYFSSKYFKILFVLKIWMVLVWVERYIEKKKQEKKIIKNKRKKS